MNFLHTADPVVTTDWRPSTQSVHPPQDTRLVLERMQDLAHLAGPTPAESIELELLICWLRLDADGNLSADKAVTLAADRLYIMASLDEAFMMRAYVMAETAWKNILKLNSGELIDHPHLDYDADVDNSDAMRAHRAARCLEWYGHALELMERFVEHEGLDTDVLRDKFRETRLYRNTRYDIARNLFDSPFSVGASLYLEPMPGSSFGEHGKIVEILDILTGSSLDALNAFRVAVRKMEEEGGDKTALVAPGDRLYFFGGMLKGYIGAGATTSRGLLMSTVMARFPGKWKAAQDILLSAREMMLEHQDVCGKDWVYHGTPLHTEIADTRLEEFFARMDKNIAHETIFLRGVR